jgi:hypothetical protein
MDFLMDKPTVKAVTEDGSFINVLINGEFQADKLEEETAEKLPISSVYKVVDYVTIFKTDLWWEAIVVFETYGKRQIGMYLWQKRNSVWKRKNKFGVRTLDEWEKLKEAVDQLAPKLPKKKLTQT